jgi:MoaA/NifB/PqqE/SkfB family radical SAM enzyme
MDKGLKPSAISERVLRGEWLITAERDRVIAQNVEDRQELEFSGDLARDVAVGGGVLLRQLARADQVFSSLAEALEGPARRPTVGEILRGSGFRIFFLELTGRCNERCQHCYASSSPEVSTALEASQVVSVIRQARELGFPTLQLTGGDPLISPHLEMAIQEAVRLGFQKLEVYTNALAFNERWAQLFSQNSVRMAVSLYSHAPAVHDSVTNTAGSHERTSRAIRLAVSHGISLRIGGVQGIHDEQDELALRDYIRELGIPDDMIAMDVQRPVGRGSWNDEVSLLPGKARGHNAASEREGGRLCVTYSGNIVPCIFDRATVLGHIDKISIKEALAQESLPGERKATLSVVGTPLSCPQCRFRHALLRTM